jgi:hypothetical protein
MGRLDDRFNKAKNPTPKAAPVFASAKNQRQALRNRADARAGVDLGKRDRANAQVTQEVAAENTASRKFSADITALQEQRPEDVRDWKQLAGLTVRLGGQDDKKSREFTSGLMSEFGAELRPHVDAIDPNWWDKNFREPKKPDLPWWQDVLQFVQPGFEYLDQWGQSSLKNVGGIVGALNPQDDISFTDGIKSAVINSTAAVDPTRLIPGDRGITDLLPFDDPLEGRLDVDESGDVGVREALGIDPGAGGKVGGLLDFLGSVLLDPTTYITLGSGSLAKIGITTAEATAARLAIAGTATFAGKRVTKELVEEMSQRAARQGFKKGLDEVEQRFYKGLIQEGIEHAAANEGGRLTTRFGRDIIGKQTQAVERGSRSGLQFAGRTVLPSGPVGDVTRRAGLTRDVKFAERAVLDGAIELPGGGILLAREAGTEAGEKALTEMTIESIQKGVVSKMFELPKVRKFLTAFSTDALVRSRFGEGVSDEFKQLRASTRETPEVKEAIVRLGADMHRNGLMARSIKEFDSQEEWSRALNSALSDPEKSHKLLSTAGQSTGELLEVFFELRSDIREAALKGGADPASLRDIDTYIPRVLSEAASRDADIMANVRSLGIVDDAPATDGRVAERFMRQRTLAPTVDDLFQTNKDVKDVLEAAGYGDVTELFETNPVAAFAARTTSAFRTAADVDLLDGVVKLRGPGGVPLGFRDFGKGSLSADNTVAGAVSLAGGRLADFRRVTLDNGTVYRIHKDIAKELEDARRVFGDPKQTNEFGALFDRVNNVWALSATVAGLNPAFHMRNHLGNVFLSFLGGNKNPATWIEAASLQGRYMQVIKRMRDEGRGFEETAENVVGEGRTLDILVGASRNGVLNDGRSLDLLRERGGRENQPTGTKRKRNLIDPSSPDSVLNKPGIATGTLVENIGRLATYLDQLNKGSGAKAAATHTKKYLFDYGDITRFEGESLRRVSRFYTFTRKNAGIHAYTLARSPAKIANAQEGSQAILDFLFDAESDTDRTLPPWMRGASIAGVGGSQLAIRTDTPFDSFEDLVNILIEPPSENLAERLGAENYAKGVMDRATSLFSGVAPASVDYLFELKSNRDSFTNRKLDPDNQFRDKSLYRAITTFFPGLGRIEKQLALAGKTRFDDDGEPIAKTNSQIQFLNFFSGLSNYELNDDTDGVGRYVLQKEAEDIIANLRDDGFDVPTVDEMRKQGDIEMRNRVVETLMYGFEDNEDGVLVWSKAITDDRLLNLVPKNVRRALGLPEPKTSAAVPRGSRPAVQEGTEEYFVQKDFDFDQTFTAIETYLGRDLSDDEKYTMISSFGGSLGVRDQENAGLEPFRRNTLLDTTERDEKAELARKEEVFNRRLSSVGLNWDGVLEDHPRVPAIQGRVSDAREAGWTEDEIRTALYFATDEGGLGWTSRADRSAINQLRGADRVDGPIPLTTERFPEQADDVSLEKLQTKVWQAAEEIKFIYQFEGWQPPTEQDVFRYSVNTLTKTEQRLLGIDPLKGAPNRKDIRPDEQKGVDAQKRLAAVQGGIQGPYRWSPTNQPEIKPWER